MFRLSSTLTTAALLLFCTSCGGAEPRVRTHGTVAGEYVLVERDGEPLPHTISTVSGGYRCTATLIRLVMTLRADGTWFEDGQNRRGCTPVMVERMETEDTSRIFHGTGRYELRGPRGDTLVMTDSALPHQPQTGVFTGDELRMILPLAPPLDTVRYLYVRQRSPDRA
ncbi:hypothetical protein [Longimicrobium sp.]|uniref:hypothetical protein n=1 Tax=Longimicrobium sp. TaxID=2029185 RepID=UPI003B3B7830